MARLPRLAIPNLPHYVSQRGHNRQPVFIDDADRSSYLRSLAEAARESRVALHAYVLMSDHIDLIATPTQAGALSTMMQRLGRRYVTGFNLRHGRRGTLWDGRFRSAVVEPGAYLLSAMCYIEWKPELEGIVRAAQDFHWSSAAHHLGLQSDPLITEHSAYWTLGNTPFEREVAYGNLAERTLTSKNLKRMTRMLEKSWTFGSDSFIAEQTRVTGRRLAPLPRGRPRGTTKLSPI